MGEELIDVRAIQIGDMKFDISDHHEITEFTYDEDAVREYLQDSKNYIIRWIEGECTGTIEFRVNKIVILKLSGAWDWAIENCPDRRVKHLIKYHKDDRVKLKNWRRAIRLIGKILEANP